MPPQSDSMTPTVGSGQYVYRADNVWQQLPDGWSLVETVGAAADSQRRVYVFNRGAHPVIVFDAQGRFLDAWGEGAFVRPHGIWIDCEDRLYLTDDLDHTIRKYTRTGELLMTLGIRGNASDTGVQNSDYRTIIRAAGPFNQPTNLAIAPTGELYVSDGYGNARVHRFSADGKLLTSWGAPGTGPGEFNLPHGICIDSTGRVFVADRENSRLQLFSPDGEFLEEWTDVARPCEMHIDADDVVYVAELGFQVGFIGNVAPASVRDNTAGRVSIFDRDGKLLSRFGGGTDYGTPGVFVAPHDIWVDPRGDVYVSEVTVSAAGRFGLCPMDCPSLQKLTRQR